LREALNNGRIISHTLVFAALLWVIAMAALRRGMYGPQAVSFGSLVHLALDEIWLKPATLFWPFLGWGFPYSQNLDKPRGHPGNTGRAYTYGLFVRTLAQKRQ